MFGSRCGYIAISQRAERLPRKVQAAHAALSGRFDIVVLDVMMPEPNGFQILAATREASAIPVMMLTARGGDDDRILTDQSRAV